MTATNGTVAIIDYGSGNLRSAEKAFARAAREGGSEAAILVTADPDRVAAADRIVLPGVGAFHDCMTGVTSIDGMADALEEAVRSKGRPFLGICVGMQLLADEGRENIVTPGLGWIHGVVRRLTPEPITACEAPLKIPHMGWNTIEPAGDHPLTAGIPLGADGWHAYFVHSYVLEPASPDVVVGESRHGESFPAIVGRETVAGTQFHPEKSQALGLALIRNFLAWTP